MSGASGGGGSVGRPRGGSSAGRRAPAPRVEETTAAASRIARLVQVLNQKLERAEADKEEMAERLERLEELEERNKRMEVIATKMKEETRRMRDKERELEMREEEINSRLGGSSVSGGMRTRSGSRGSEADPPLHLPPQQQHQQQQQAQLRGSGSSSAGVYTPATTPPTTALAAPAHAGHGHHAIDSVPEATLRILFDRIAALSPTGTATRLALIKALRVDNDVRSLFQSQDHPTSSQYMQRLLTNVPPHSPDAASSPERAEDQEITWEDFRETVLGPQAAPQPPDVSTVSTIHPRSPESAFSQDDTPRRDPSPPPPRHVELSPMLATNGPGARDPSPPSYTSAYPQPSPAAGHAHVHAHASAHMQALPAEARDADPSPLQLMAAADAGEHLGASGATSFPQGRSVSPWEAAVEDQALHMMSVLERAGLAEADPWHDPLRCVHAAVDHGVPFVDIAFPPGPSSAHAECQWRRVGAAADHPHEPHPLSDPARRETLTTTATAGICSNRRVLSILCLLGDPSQLLTETAEASVHHGYVQARVGDETVAIDTFLPSIDGCAVHAWAGDRELWVPLVEKAIAKAKGSYAALERARPSLADIVGWVVPHAALVTFATSVTTLPDLLQSAAAGHLHVLVPRPTAASRLADIGSLYTIAAAVDTAQQRQQQAATPTSAPGTLDTMSCLVWCPVASQDAGDGGGDSGDMRGPFDAQWIPALELVALFSEWHLVDVRETFATRRAMPEEGVPPPRAAEAPSPTRSASRSGANAPNPSFASDAAGAAPTASNPAQLPSPAAPPSLEPTPEIRPQALPPVQPRASASPEVPEAADAASRVGSRASVASSGGGGGSACSPRSGSHRQAPPSVSPGAASTAPAYPDFSDSAAERSSPALGAVGPPTGGSGTFDSTFENDRVAVPPVLVERVQARGADDVACGRRTMSDIAGGMSPRSEVTGGGGGVRSQSPASPARSARSLRSAGSVSPRAAAVRALSDGPIDTTADPSSGAAATANAVNWQDVVNAMMSNNAAVLQEVHAHKAEAEAAQVGLAEAQAMLAAARAERDEADLALRDVTAHNAELQAQVEQMEATIAEERHSWNLERAALQEDALLRAAEAGAADNRATAAAARITELEAALAEHDAEATRARADAAELHALCAASLAAYEQLAQQVEVQREVQMRGAAAAAAASLPPASRPAPSTGEWGALERGLVDLLTELRDAEASALDVAVAAEGRAVEAEAAAAAATAAAAPASPLSSHRASDSPAADGDGAPGDARLVPAGDGDDPCAYDRVYAFRRVWWDKDEALRWEGEANRLRGAVRECEMHNDDLRRELDAERRVGEEMVVRLQEENRALAAELQRRKDDDVASAVRERHASANFHDLETLQLLLSEEVVKSEAFAAQGRQHATVLQRLADALADAATPTPLEDLPDPTAPAHLVEIQVANLLDQIAAGRHHTDLLTKQLADVKTAHTEEVRELEALATEAASARVHELERQLADAIGAGDLRAREMQALLEEQAAASQEKIHALELRLAGGIGPSLGSPVPAAAASPAGRPMLSPAVPPTPPTAAAEAACAQQAALIDSLTRDLADERARRATLEQQGVHGVADTALLERLQSELDAERRTCSQLRQQMIAVAKASPASPAGLGVPNLDTVALEAEREKYATLARELQNELDAERARNAVLGQNATVTATQLEAERERCQQLAADAARARAAAAAAELSSPRSPYAAAAVGLPPRDVEKELDEARDVNAGLARRLQEAAEMSERDRVAIDKLTEELEAERGRCRRMAALESAVATSVADAYSQGRSARMLSESPGVVSSRDVSPCAPAPVGGESDLVYQLRGELEAERQKSQQLLVQMTQLRGERGRHASVSPPGRGGAAFVRQGVATPAREGSCDPAAAAAGVTSTDPAVRDLMRRVGVLQMALERAEHNQHRQEREHVGRQEAAAFQLTESLAEVTDLQEQMVEVLAASDRRYEGLRATHEATKRDLQRATHELESTLTALHNRQMREAMSPPPASAGAGGARSPDAHGEPAAPNAEAARLRLDLQELAAQHQRALDRLAEMRSPHRDKEASAGIAAKNDEIAQLYRELSTATGKIVDLERLRARNAEENLALQAQVRSARVEITQLLREVGDSGAGAAVATPDDNDVTDLRVENGRLRDEAAQLRVACTQLNALEEALQKSEKKCQAVCEELGKTKRELGQVERSLAVANERKNTVERELADAKLQVERLTDEALRREGRLEEFSSDTAMLQERVKELVALAEQRGPQDDLVNTLKADLQQALDQHRSVSVKWKRVATALQEAKGQLADQELQLAERTKSLGVAAQEIKALHRNREDLQASLDNQQRTIDALAQHQHDAQTLRHELLTTLSERNALQQELDSVRRGVRK